MFNVYKHKVIHDLYTHKIFWHLLSFLIFTFYFQNENSVDKKERNFIIYQNVNFQGISSKPRYHSVCICVNSLKRIEFLCNLKTNKKTNKQMITLENTEQRSIGGAGRLTPRLCKSEPNTQPSWVFNLPVHLKCEFKKE